MRNNRIYIFLCALLATVVQQSCENYDDVIPKEFDTILLLKESGEQDLTLYDTGDEESYEVTVFKSGNAVESTPKVVLKTMETAELESYSELIGKEYKAIPTSMYRIENGDLNFSSSERYKKSKIVINTPEIKTFLENNTEGTYIFPIELEKVSASDSINSEKKILILKPNVVMPKISFAEANANLTVNEDGATYELKLTLPFSSPWDFEATIGINEGALPEGSSIIPSGQYSLKDGGKIKFRKGETTSEPLVITLNKSGGASGSYVLPLEVKEITKRIALPTAPFMLRSTFN